MNQPESKRRRRESAKKKKKTRGRTLPNAWAAAFLARRTQVWHLWRRVRASQGDRLMPYANFKMVS